ncbi:insulinase family protein [Anaerococcus degeneri]|uniref:Insulinase family protein n=1 Tax=Anaerococcus degeneri TaxID=361500 RepID=A0ABS7Z234_9FIRM|nr:insulinase family protein [Anaerococcus degeneri]MBP2016210.1 Zn-dependent M16 (insulinase) family peptidase [Anaerococcus degeneri]MCA2096586.1 insulinase family protein [Anaerococcus degeneri]
MNKNYELIKSENFPAIGIEAFHYRHIKTGAKLVFAKKDDTNKTFAIGFKTPPTNSKGMAHIMEHSVLNGSKKYPTKDPFMAMDSSSLQTFLNAMTYPDKTVFPVSSENDKDFRNLVDVYTDAVFAPLVVDKKQILDQEGWHYDIDGDQVVGVSGVVYNEMKGALSDPESIIDNDINSYLYKNSPYQYESGGDPRFIKDLTFEEFQKFYADHYHPSNAYIYFYGNIDDIDPYLTRLDEEYLSKYEAKSMDLGIEVKENFYDKEVESTYPASEEKPGQDYLTYAMLTHSALDIKETLTATILVNALFNMDSSKIRNEIQEILSPEYFYARNAYGNRSGLIIQAQKTDAGKANDFVEIIEKGLKKASQGINKEALKSAFSLFDFGQRESLNSVNSGLNYYLSMSFDADPFEVFRLVDYLKDLRALIDTSYYEDFIKKFYLDNPTKLVHIARPSVDYNKNEEEDFQRYLDKVNEEMSPEKLSKIKEDLEKLKAYQDREDTEEEKATIPKLDIKDVPTKTREVPREVENDTFEYVYNDLSTAGLIYTDMYFNLNHLNLEDFKYAQIIGELLGSIDTKTMKYTEIDDLIWQKLGPLNFSIMNFKKGADEIDRTFKVSFKTLPAYTREACQIVKDFTENSLFANQARILELLKIRKAVFESKMYDIGHMIAINRANAHIDKHAYLQENLSGIAYYDFIKENIALAENDFAKVQERLESVYKRIFTKDLSINITSEKDGYDLMKAGINEAFADLGGREADLEIEFVAKAKKEAIMADANVNYVAKSANFYDFEGGYDGKFLLAGSIMSNPYLYSLIRAQGGAYGAGMFVSRSMLLATYSYRDPNISSTIDSFNKIGQIAKDLEMTERDFENQKISSMGTILRPRNPKQMGDADYAYFRIPSSKKEDDILAEIKTASLDDIKALSESFDKAMDLDNLVVFGARSDIEKNKDLFDEIKDLK